MALGTLNGVKEIGGFPVVVMDDLRELHPDKFNESGAMDYKWFEKDVRPHHFVYVRKDVNSISFTLQNGTVKDMGINGCQVDALIHAAKLIVEGLNEYFPCTENKDAIRHLGDALYYLELRTKNRVKRGVEGMNTL